MKQDAFIQQLRQGLASLPKQEVEEIVADYREYIGDAIAAGRNEEEVVAALGDPAKLAREIKAQATYRQWQARRSFGNLARVVASVAGLGLLNLILLLPFLIYLLLLTAGYLVSGAFAIGGLVTVVSLCSHHAFGWPPTEQPSIHISTKSNRAASGISTTAKNASDEAPDFGDVKVDGDHFVLKLDDGDKALITTRAGLVVLKNEDGETKMVALGSGADKLLTPADDHTYRIATKDVTTMVVKDDDGKSVKVKHAGGNDSTLVWDIRDDDGSDAEHVQFEQDANGKTPRLSLRSGTDSVVIDANKGITLNDDDDNVVRIVAPMGWSLGAMTFRYALMMLIGGVLGLIVCIWLTRLTWRALSRYVHRQIDAISARLDEHEHEQPS
ncbi:DUF1700 domain-containing protein [Trinickia dinghuensis]|uniref:DUF1700 domain-containing protein n=1 Tax=Trinickia dinghuensis TaxID=2291023 RepID=A0A3D8K182_9BURK|nr:DUF1700 domain-containing protein [Trinickia dinghuensis]RDU98676.1 DUF1700 domain-containing protein [Trinickia dinghuensis]